MEVVYLVWWRLLTFWERREEDVEERHVEICVCSKKCLK
jgi:hypothetical protein